MVIVLLVFLFLVILVSGLLFVLVFSLLKPAHRSTPQSAFSWTHITDTFFSFNDIYCATSDLWFTVRSDLLIKSIEMRLNQHIKCVRLIQID